LLQITQEDDELTEQERLKREIYALEGIIKSNATVLASKTMSNDDRESLRRQMTRRVATRRLMKQRLARLSNLPKSQLRRLV
jgi:hypothetical protein